MGLLHEDRLRELLTTIGDRFTDDEVSLLQSLVEIQSVNKKGQKI